MTSSTLELRGASRANQILPRLLPSVFDIPFLVFAVGLGLRFNVALLNSDGDLSRHLRVGDYILSQRQILHHDVFSFTMYGKPFVPYEWLSEVTFALANRVGGLAAVAILAALIIAATYLALVTFLRRRHVEPVLVLGTALLSLGLGSLHWIARPHIFTTLLAILLLFLLEGDTGGRRAWRYMPLFALWANLHGGFLFGLVMIAVYLAGDAAELRFGTDAAYWRTRLRGHARALVLALLSCGLTPAGLGLFGHVSGYLGQSYLVDHTVEYQSPDFHIRLVQLFLVAILVAMAGLALNPRRPSFPRLLLILTTTAFGLYSGRNIPLFAVTALPLLALEFDAVWRRRPARLARLTAAMSQSEAEPRFPLWPLLASVALILIGLNGGVVAGQQLSSARFDPRVFPVDAVQAARDAGLTGHIYADLPWGGYLLSAWPEQKVFIDGQTDFYGADLMRDSNTIVDLDPGWRETLAKWDISLVLTPTDSRLASELAREPGWRVWYQDQTATLLQRDPAGAQATTTAGRA